MWLTGLWPSPPILGWPPESCMGASPTTPDTFSSSRRFKHAALGLRLRSGSGDDDKKKRGGNFSKRWKTSHATSGVRLPSARRQTDLGLVVLNWGWHWRPGAGWEVWSEVCRGWGAAGTFSRAPWTPRWCPVLWDARGRCWPLGARARAPTWPRGGRPRRLPLDCLGKGKRRRKG